VVAALDLLFVFFLFF